MSRIRINTSIAGERWSAACGEVIDESDARYAECVPLTRGPLADFVEDAPAVESASVEPAENAAVRRGKRR